MSNSVDSTKKNKKKGGKLIPALCNIAGTLILLLVIVTAIPATMPRLFGYLVYNVVSPSMEPEIAVGSIILVDHSDPADLEEGDIIAFYSENSVVAHRVENNKTVEGKLVTKGDANAEADLSEVDYENVIGKVVFHAPIIGSILTYYTTTVGKVYALMLAACGVMFNMLAGRLRERRKLQA